MGDYVKRFNDTLGREICLKDSAVIMTFRVGLKPNWFTVSLYNKKPGNLAIVMERAYNEIEIEDMLEEKYKEIRANKGGEKYF